MPLSDDQSPPHLKTSLQQNKKKKQQPYPFVLLAAAFVANLDLVRAMSGHGGPWVAFKCLLYHQVYYVYSATIYVWCLFEYHVLGQKQKLHVTRN